MFGARLRGRGFGPANVWLRTLATMAAGHEPDRDNRELLTHNKGETVAVRGKRGREGIKENQEGKKSTCKTHCLSITPP